MLNTIEHLDIDVTTRHDLELRLKAALAVLQETAMRTRAHGILVTRKEPGKYTAALSDQVPYGLTRELFRESALCVDRGCCELQLWHPVRATSPSRGGDYRPQSSMIRGVANFRRTG